MKLSHHRDTKATESMFCFSLLLRREQRKRDMPFGRVLSIGELTRRAGAFPFLPSQQKRENAISVSLAKSPQKSAETSEWWERCLVPLYQNDRALERVRN
jgi:hypothetical protein